MLAILIAMFIGAWGLPTSLTPQTAQRIEKQTQPTQQNTAAEPSINEKEQKTDNWAGKKESDQSRLDRIVKFVREYNAEIVAISTAVMGLFTVALFIATWALWKSGEKHSERELRAYVFPTDVKVRNFKISERISAFVKVENSGQTPAYKVTCQVKMIAGPFPQTDFTISEEESDYAPGYIGAYGKVQYTPADAPLTWEQAEDVCQGRWAIYVFGRIDYVDAFKVPRLTTFRAFARGDHGRMYLAEEGTKDVLAMVFDEGGNDAT